MDKSLRRYRFGAVKVNSVKSRLPRNSSHLPPSFFLVVAVIIDRTEYGRTDYYHSATYVT